MKRLPPFSLRPKLLAALRLLTLAIFIIQLAPAQEGSSPTPQQEPSREPVLRIETGMHTAVIRRIGVDAANRFLVTASDDKTVRVWELPSGRLLRVIRVPVGAGNEGRLYAVAISPDGSTIAVGGWTRNESGSVESIYLFDRESGRMVDRIRKLPQVVFHLVYSPDGRYLAATLFGTNGVRVFNTTTYDPVGEDRDYGDDIYGADFDRKGRLATTSYDGFIRLYAPVGNGPLRLIAKQKSAGGERPFSIRFSPDPDGSRIAVGFADTTHVAILSGADLSPLPAPDTRGVNNGSLQNVSWSADGKTLYAGGMAQDTTVNFFIREWKDGGRGSYRDIVAAANTIMHLLPLRDGGIVYGAFDPAFGVIDASGKRQLFTSAQIADYGNNLQGFLLAPDGAGVAFGYKVFGESPARFSLAERRLDAALSGDVNWREPITEAEGLRVTGWYNTYEPKLNGARLKIDQHERSLSLAIAPDKSSFLLGADWYVRLYDRSGKEVWPNPIAAPGAAWAVNISADGRLAVAAYSDGTIRWYSMKDGKELLAFFPHADRKRWVMWTPSGYYDASPGAEELIGWHVNNGRDQAADFFPVGQFRETFYRPDVVSKVLKTLNEQLALKQANDERGLKQQRAEVEDLLPPVVDIISPSDGAQITPGEVTVRYRLRSPTVEPVTSVMAMVDGKTAAVEHSLNLRAVGEGVEREIKVKIPAGASLVSVLAMNRFAPSVAATTQISTGSVARDPRSEKPTEAATAAPKPVLHVLAVGVGKYTNGIRSLNFPAKDAADFAAAMQNQKGRRYRDVIVRTLPNASREQILDGLEWISKVPSTDVAMIFLAGHGVTDDNDFYYFLPAEADLNRLKSTGVPFAEIVNTLEAIKGQKVLFVDTCRSGAVLGRRGIIDLNGIANTLNRAEYGVAVFTASSGNESAEENTEWKNGAFTKALLEGLNGQADLERSGEIDFSMLDRYITRRVLQLTQNRQTPTATKPLTVPNFTLASLN